jgi:leader peptidase (prepilin peptidase) / N-methyltransferase
MQYFFEILVFLFGAALGSFICVVAGRYGTGLPFIKGRSVCFSCNTELKSKDLFPIFSFLFLKGKCRYCQSKIPKETFFTEIVMGILSVLAALKVGLFVSYFSLLLTTNYLLLTFIFATILLISVYDLKHFIIPDSFLISLFVFSLIYLFFFPVFNSPLLLTTYYLLLWNLLSGIILTIPFLLIFVVSKGTWFGLGDVKYIAVFGFLLGFSTGLSAIVLAFWVGAAFSIIAMLLKKVAPNINLPLLRNNLTIKSEIPFGPFISIGIIASLYFGLDIFHIHELFF